MTTYTIRTEGAALNFYNAVLALAQQAPEIKTECAELVHIKHNTQLFTIRCARARLLAFSDAILNGWALFGGGAKPAREKKTRSAWPTRMISVIRACWQDGDLESVYRIAQTLGGFVGLNCDDENKCGALYVAPYPIEGYEDEGMVLAMDVGSGKWQAIHLRSGFTVGLAKSTKSGALESFGAVISRVGEEFARTKMSAVDNCALDIHDWAVFHGVAQDVAESKAAAPVEIEAADGAAAQAEPEQAAAEDYTITIKPLSTRGKPYAIVRCPSSDGYKTRAARLASSIARDRYSHRQGGYVMSTAAAARFEALYAEGADACTITGNVYNPSAVNDVIEQASSVAESGAPVADTTCSGIAPASPEYVALRSAAREARRAALAAIDTARVSSAQALRELTADDSDYSYLIPSDGTRRGGVHAAKNIRLVLKKKFPGVKFSVKSDYSRCSVKWTDGPTDAAVSEALAPFDIGASDSQSDYFYTVATRFSDTYGGVQYLFTSRELSAATIQASIAAIFGDSGPTPEEWKAGRAWSQVSGHGIYSSCAMMGEWEWLAMVRRHANGLDY